MLQILFECSLCDGLHQTHQDLVTHYGVLHRLDTLQYRVVPMTKDDDKETVKEKKEIGVQLSDVPPMMRQRGMNAFWDFAKCAIECIRLTFQRSFLTFWSDTREWLDGLNPRQIVFRTE